MARYGQAFKDKAVARLLPPESADVVVVSREIGVSVATLERWRADALASGKKSGGWTAAARFEAVLFLQALRGTGGSPAAARRRRTSCPNASSETASGSGQDFEAMASGAFIADALLKIGAIDVGEQREERPSLIEPVARGARVHFPCGRRSDEAGRRAGSMRSVAMWSQAASGWV